MDPEDPMKLLELAGVGRSFGGLRAVDGVTFDVEQGAIHGIIGPNGAGKTTLFNLVAGAMPADQGEIRYKGESIQGLPSHRVARKGIGRTFQTIRLFPHMTVLENVAAGRHIRTRAGFLSGMLSLPRARREERESAERALEILERLGIAELADRRAGTLAFGRQRVVEFARALALEPELLLLDEPAAGLNHHETGEIAGLIRAIRDRGVTPLLIEHDMSLVMEISDRILVLHSGRAIAEGTPSEIQRNREVIDLYLGTDDAPRP
jgi:branched-chain amino acid transport system ATP-binding protein